MSESNKKGSYTKNEVIEESAKYFDNNILPAEVFLKYSLSDKNDNMYEPTPEFMHRRLAKEYARIESNYPNPLTEDQIFNRFDKFKFIVPQGSPMFGIGNPYQTVSISNCFVIDTVDSYGGICRTDERIAQISKRRGGVGVDISLIRPKGLSTNNSALTTDGIVVFMDRFSNTSREVAQNGRRGALMITINVHHPEVLNFIKAKLDLKRVTGANISVRLTDEFMNAVNNNSEYEQRWPVDSSNPKIKKMVNAKEIWDEIINCAHNSGEPGVLFWDNIIRNSPSDSYKDLGWETISTNPCGELPLAGNGGSCILMLQNLSSFVMDPFSTHPSIDVTALKENTRIAMRLIDDMVDLEIEAVDHIIDKIEKDPESNDIKFNESSLWKMVRKTCFDGRRTGLGITALGDTIAMMNMKYGSPESISLVERIFEIIRNETYRTSIELAKERGAFPIWNHELEKNNEFLNRLPPDILKDMSQYGRRNIACMTIAPAGSVSILTQTTSGFEPLFMDSYIRKKKLFNGSNEEPDFIDELGDKWKNYKITHKGIELYERLNPSKTFEDSPYYGSLAEDINYIDRVKMQATAQKYIDHSISSTVNLPNDVSIKVVDELYRVAWSSGCKGLTVYRDGCRDGVLTKIESSNYDKNFKIQNKERDKVVECEIHRSKVGGGDWLFFIGLINGNPYEVFGGSASAFTIPHKYKTGWICKNGKDESGITQYNLVLGSLDDENEKLEFKGIAKHFNNSEYGSFTRVISLSLRYSIPIKHVCEQLVKSGCEGDLFSFQRAMSRILKKYISDGEKTGSECPECKSEQVYYKNGCPTCKICGYSHCM